ncbi:MAG: hypothetical protein WBJ13_00160 [Sedimentibacter sp.]
MKKIISICMAIVLLGSVSITAFASTSNDSSKLDIRIESLEKKQQRIEELKTNNEEKMEKYEAFKQSLTEEQQEILNNAEENISISAQTNQLRIDLAQTLNAMSKAGIELEEETNAQLKDYNAQVLKRVEDLKVTKGQIKAIVEENKEFIKERDYESMDTAYDEILSIQSYRYELIIKINELLKEMNALLEGSAL